MTLRNGPPRLSLRALSIVLALAVVPTESRAESSPAPARGLDWWVPSILPWRFGLGIDGGVGAAPALAPALSLHVGAFEFDDFLGLELRYAFRGASSFAGAELGVALATASLLGCHAFGGLEFCALAGGGAAFVDQPGGGGRAESLLPTGFVGGRAGLRLELSSTEAWHAELTLLVPMLPVVLPVGGAEAWRSGPVGLTFGLRYATVAM